MAPVTRRAVAAAAAQLDGGGPSRLDDNDGRKHVDEMDELDEIIASQEASLSTRQPRTRSASPLPSTSEATSTRARRPAALTARERIAAIHQRRRRTIQARRIRNSLSPSNRWNRYAGMHQPVWEAGVHVEEDSDNDSGTTIVLGEDDDEEGGVGWIGDEEEYDPAESWSDQEDDEEKERERNLVRSEDLAESRNKKLRRTKEYGPCTICYREEVVHPVGCKQCMNFLGCQKCIKRWHRMARAHSLTSVPTATCPLCRALWIHADPDVTVHFGRKKDVKKVICKTKAKSV